MRGSEMTDFLRVEMPTDARLEPCTTDSSTMPECAAPSPDARTTTEDPARDDRAREGPGCAARRATGVGVEGGPGPEPRDGDAGERLRHVTINRGAGGHGLAR